MKFQAAKCHHNRRSKDHRNMDLKSKDLEITNLGQPKRLKEII
jgi:hypothetical protein